MRIILNPLFLIITSIIDKTSASRHIMLIRRSSNNIWIICIYKGELGIHITLVDLFVARTGWRLFKALFPAESPKSVFVYEHDTGGDAP